MILARVVRERNIRSVVGGDKKYLYILYKKEMSNSVES